MKKEEIINEFLEQILSEKRHNKKLIISSLEYGGTIIKERHHDCSWVHSEIFEARILYSITDFKFYYIGWAQEFGGSNTTCFEFESILLPDWLKDALKNESMWRISKN